MKDDWRVLWPSPLPKWNPDKLFALFKRVRSRRADQNERNDYIQHLVVCICAVAGRSRWIKSARNAGLDAQEMLTDILEWLYFKTPKIKLENPCSAVLVAYLSWAVHNRFISLLRKHKQKADRYLAISQIHIPEDGEEPDYEAPEVPGTELTPTGTADILRSREEDLCKGTGKTKTLFKHLCRSIEISSIPTYEQLPPKLKKSVTNEQHAMLVLRINREIERHVQGSPD